MLNCHFCLSFLSFLHLTLHEELHMAVKKAAKKKAGKVAKPVVKKGAVSKPYNKTEIYTELSEFSCLPRKQVGAVFEGLQGIIERHLKKGAPGVFILPGLLKCQVIHKPATKARKGVNPFTGEEMMFKAKPARNIVKVRALKKLKAMV